MIWRTHGEPPTSLDLGLYLSKLSSDDRPSSLSQKMGWVSGLMPFTAWAVDLGKVHDPSPSSGQPHHALSSYPGSPCRAHPTPDLIIVFFLHAPTEFQTQIQSLTAPDYSPPRNGTWKVDIHSSVNLSQGPTHYHTRVLSWMKTCGNCKLSQQLGWLLSSPCSSGFLFPEGT